MDVYFYIDDLCIFNNNEPENNFEDISPDELELKNENGDSCKGSFLEYLIEVLDRKFITKLFYKRCLSFLH